MNLSDKARIPEEVLARQVGEEVVILNLASGTYFGLDPIGARIWQLMSDGRTLAEICDCMQAEYAVSREDIERDVIDLAQALCARQLIAAA